MFAAASPFLIMVGTGLLFNPKGGPLRRAATIAAGKLGCSAGVTLALTTALGLGGVDRGVLLLLGMAPVGFIVVTYAALEDLDVDLAAQALALSMALSFVLSVGLTALLA
jgi:predicted permease